ncbi:MAG: serine hydroxymethyltransferase, partial [Candidatus Dadabacteria bacterium]|nr:serine hydroxymethyltransferase [Candidatus Dadabacteria bacterium]
IDLRETELTGKIAEDTLELAGITVNKNAIPFDPHPPTITSGIRIGTPAITTRGMKEDEMGVIAGFINEALINIDNGKVLSRIKDDVRELCHKFPMYKDRLV